MKFGWFLPVVAAIAVSTAPAAAPQVGNGRIAFVRNVDIWTIGADGTGEARLTNGEPGPVGTPLLWSPDGSLLAAATEAFDPRTAVSFVVREDGDGLVRLPLTGSRPGCWLGPDRLVLVGYSGDAVVPRGDLFAVNADGSGLEQLTFDGIPKAVTQQGCARDGSKIVYERTETRPTGAPGPVVYWISLAGGPAVRLTPDDASDISATLSPDGRSIALLRSTTSVPAPRLVVVDLEGHVESEPSQAYAVSSPLWSPEGRLLLFQAERFINQGSRGEFVEHDVQEAAADGSGERRLTSGSRPRWSPDGTRILFGSSRPPEAKDLWVANSVGTCPTPLTTAADADWQPAPGVPPAEPIRCADLSIVTGSRSDAIASGGTGYLSFTLENIGNETATGVSIDFDTAGVTGILSFQAAPGATCSQEAAECRISSLPVGGSVPITVVVRWNGPLDFSGRAERVDIVVTATASAPEPDPDRSNNDARATTSAYPCSQVGPGFRQSNVLRGTPGRDVLCGLTGGDYLYGLAGSDALVGGPGADFLDGGPGRDVLSGGGEFDTILASDGERDEVDCGGSREDLAVVDRIDEVGNCGIVVRPLIHCRGIGTRSPDRLVGTRRRDVLCGLGGGDTINGLLGNDALDGGQGNDTVDGGPGRDLLFGGPGYDVLLARDGERDVIDCGPNFDIAIADRLDRVARNCENVRRPRKRGSRTG